MECVIHGCKQPGVIEASRRRVGELQALVLDFEWAMVLPLRIRLSSAALRQRGSKCVQAACGVGGAAAGTLYVVSGEGTNTSTHS